MKACTVLITAPGSAPYTLDSRPFPLSQSNLKQGRVSEGKAHTGWEAKERLTAFVTTYRPFGPVTKVILIHLSTCGPERQTQLNVHQETIFLKLNPRGQMFTTGRSKLAVSMLFPLVNK